MAYTFVNDIEKVSVGQNFYYPGSLMLSREDDAVYVCVGEKYFKFKRLGYEENSKYSSKVFKYGTTPRIIYGKFIAFKLEVNGANALYMTITSADTNLPILIYKEIQDGKYSDGTPMKNTYFCYNPIVDEGKDRYVGSIGYVSEDLYATVYNKSRLLKNRMPSTDYVGKAKKLLAKIEKCKVLPLNYSVEHEDITLVGVLPYEVNKKYYISKLNDVISNYSNGKIYYSEILKRLELKYKTTLNYFKNI